MCNSLRRPPSPGPDSALLARISTNERKDRDRDLRMPLLGAHHHYPRHVDCHRGAIEKATVLRSVSCGSTAPPSENTPSTLRDHPSPPQTPPWVPAELSEPPHSLPSVGNPHILNTPILSQQLPHQCLDKLASVRGVLVMNCLSAFNHQQQPKFRSGFDSHCRLHYVT